MIMCAKILIIRKGNPGGGIERSSSIVANYFASKDQDVTLLSFYSSPTAYNTAARVKHIQIHLIENKNRIGKIISRSRSIRENVKNMRPDVILSYGEYMNIPVLIATIGLQIPVIISDRLSPAFSISKVYDIIKKILYRRASGCIAQTDIAKSMLVSKIKIKSIAVIPNPIHEITKVDCEKKKQIICVGRISPEKGQKYLLEAFAAQPYKDWHLVFVGGVSNESTNIDLQLLVQKYSLSERVLFLGRKEDFSKELSESEIFVLPSLSEGYPNALIEAMSVPLPCISSDCIAGPSDIIKNGINGILVEPGNVDALAKAITLLIENKDLRDNLAKEAYKIRNVLAVEKIAQKYLNYVLSFLR